MRGVAMELEEDLKKLIHQLVHRDIGSIELNGSFITVRVLEDDSLVSLSTPVYLGGNYIPKSVRGCLKEHPPFTYHLTIKTFLSLDEEHFQINLNYLGVIEEFDRSSFKRLLEEFSRVAEEWRYYLDEHDRHDLVHVRVI
jgi:hypothetical protein